MARLKGWPLGSARPGYSEHQTGLTFDLIGTNGRPVTEEKRGPMAMDHAADYGFVVRYLSVKGKRNGLYGWRMAIFLLRRKEAKDIAASGLSLEE